MNKKLKPIKAHYSGNASTNFWLTVNRIKNKADAQELYSLGVALQNLESYVLKQMQHIKGDKKVKL